MKTIERLKQFIDYKAISLTQFDKLIGAGNGYIGKQIQRGASIGSDVIETIVSNFPELSPAWLVAGVGNMLIPHDGSRHLNEDTVVYEQVPLAKNATKSNRKLHPKLNPTHDLGVKTIYLTPQFITVDSAGDENILHISQRAAAGYLNGYADPEYLQRQPSFKLPGLTDATYRSFVTDGDSMNPTLKDKEMVIGRWVEKIDYIRDDRVHILVTKHDGIIIKRLLNRVNEYNKVIAKSDATNDRNLYPNIEVDPADILEIWYAVFHGGFDFQSPTDMWKRVNNHEADLTILRNQVDRLVNVVKTAGLLPQ